MDVSGGLRLTVGSHHEAPYGWIPTEDGEDRAIVGGVVLLVQACGRAAREVSYSPSTCIAAARASTGRPLALDAVAAER